MVMMHYTTGCCVVVFSFQGKIINGKDGAKEGAKGEERKEREKLSKRGLRKRERGSTGLRF